MDDILNERNEVVDVSNDEAVAEYFAEIVKDPVIQSMLFDCLIGKFSYGNISRYKIVQAIKNVIATVFTVVFVRWKQLYDNVEEWDEDDIEFFRNTRFSKIFKSVLEHEEITEDLQVFALIEVWVNYKKNTEIATAFGDIFNLDRSNDDFGINLKIALDIIKNTTFKEEGKYTKEECNRICCKLLNAFVVLSEISVDYKNGFEIKYKSGVRKTITLKPNESDPNVPFVCTEPYLLEKRGTPSAREYRRVAPYMLVAYTRFNDKIQYIYRSFNGESEAVIDAGEDVEPERKNTIDAVEFKKFFSFNYKSIRDFAMVISDAIVDKDDQKREVFKLCSEKCPTLTEGISSYNSEDVYWDNVITILLVEMGPSDFLEKIMNNDVYRDVMRNIECRLIGKSEGKEISKKYAAEVESIKAQCGKNVSLYNYSVKTLQIENVITAIGLNNDNNKVFNPYEESLSYKYDNMNENLNILRQFSENMENVNIKDTVICRAALVKSFKELFLFLLMFYEGSDAYSENYQHTLNLQNRHERRDKALLAFVASARRCYFANKDKGLCETYELFEKLCDEYNTGRDSDCFRINEKAQNLRFIISRNYICDTSKMRFFTNITLKDGTKSNIFEMLENFSDKYYLDSSFPEWLDYFNDFFMFLVYNEDYNKRGLFKEISKLDDRDFDPIHPYIVSYYRENIDKDNLKKCNYKVPIPNSSKGSVHEGVVVTLLTEDNYRSNENYFCIPLRYGSTDNWWINPFMIPTSKFITITEDLPE